MRLFARIRNLYRQRQQWKWLIKAERKNKYHLSWPHRLRAWRKGYLSERYLWYGLDRRDDTDFISDRIRYTHTPGLNGPYRVLLDDKLIFREVFRRHEELMPEAYALAREERVLSLSRDEPIGSVDDVLRLLSRKRRLVLKPITGGGSERLRAWRKGFLSYSHRFYGLDGRDASDHDSAGGRPWMGSSRSAESTPTCPTSAGTSS